MSTPACLHAATAIISDVYKDHGREAALKACDDLIEGVLTNRRIITGFIATAEYLDALAHHDAGIIAMAQARAREDEND